MKVCSLLRFLAVVKVSRKVVFYVRERMLAEVIGLKGSRSRR